MLAGAMEAAEGLRFDKKHPLHFTLVALFGSVVELTHGLKVLQDAGATCAVPSAFRTLLETRVEFVNLLADAKYGYFMEAADLKETLKMLRAARDGRNPYLTDIAALPNLLDLTRQLEDRLEELRREGYHSLQIVERFERAGMKAEYESIYNSLSTDSDSNRRALVDRHVELDEGDFELVFFKKSSDEYSLPYLDSASTYLLESTREILALLATKDSVGAFDAVLASIPELQGRG